MISYIDVLNNDFVVNQYNEIDKINPYPFNHGLKHVTNVCKIMSNLCEVLNIDGDKREALLIACALHDVGQLDGRDRHGYKARKIAEKLMDAELRENPFYDEMMFAIENHDEVCSLEYSLFTIMVQFADKMDFTVNRLEKNYKEKFGYRVWEDFLFVSFIYDSDKFGINIRANEIEGIAEEFLKQNFTTKIINAVKVLAEKLGVEPIVCINGDRSFFAERFLTAKKGASPKVQK